MGNQTANRATGKPGLFVFNRRQFLVGVPAALAWAAWPNGAVAQGSQPAASPQPFDFARLREIAKALAAKAYVAPKPAPKILQQIGYDMSWKITFRPDRELWRDGSGPFPISLFHLDQLNTQPVRINVVSGGVAHQVPYSNDDFDFHRAPEMEKKLPADLGFSGFRVMNGPSAKSDWLAFQGASYFRSAGQDDQYGGSARGIAVNTSASTKEEFPRFTEFWLAEPDPQKHFLTIYALLDGPSLTGAYQFIAHKEKGAVMDVQAELFIRNDIAQIGIAPLTSMYWYGENDRQYATDWRPEIHDSDGLALWTGSGERIWRPLIDPPSVLINSFLDNNPKGFGLMQRDRAFDNYQDDGAFYNRRPSIWVKPQGNWGAGAVILVEIPTRDETHDNIVAFWKPKKPVKAGDQIKLAYRLYWQNQCPDFPTNTARVVATRIGQGGQPGKQSAEDHNRWKFVIDFEGGPLSQIKSGHDVTPVVSTSRGKIERAMVSKVKGVDRWRTWFDVDALGKEQLDLRCFLRHGDTTLSETWLYQFFPPPRAA